MMLHYLITGGAGFIGSNYVSRLLTRGEKVTIYDNMSRIGAPRNIEHLRNKFGNDSFILVIGDVKDAPLLISTVRNVDVIIHLAGQVAVTTSVQNPRADFESNAFGTFNVLEAARLSNRNPIVLYASTNKVYGEMNDLGIVEKDTRYQYADLPFGISESYPLDFHSPYGCSKGTGDQYVRDYHRIFGLPTIVFRQSTIYGPHQFGIEDQGWMAWLMIAAITGKQITIYGDGKQIRDMLYIDDLLNGYDAAVENISVSAGQVYNIGGGPRNVISIWKEFGPLLGRMLNKKIPVIWDDWRPGDQKIYISDIRKVQQNLGWGPSVGIDVGAQKLIEWILDNRNLFD